MALIRPLWRHLIVAAAALPMASHGEDVCRGIGPSEPAAHRELDQAASTALSLKNAVVRQVFSDGTWRILYATSSGAEGVYIFYSSHSQPARPVATWAGAARADETAEIARWVKGNAPGIPDRLAHCFSSYVATRRTM
jgi:hypothetical protein